MIESTPKTPAVGKPWNSWQLVIMACLTLGLALFFPEPHILGKICWVVGGAIKMSVVDWFDLVFHGLPWLLLIRIAILRVIHR